MSPLVAMLIAALLAPIVSLIPVLLLLLWLSGTDPLPCLPRLRGRRSAGGA